MPFVLIQFLPTRPSLGLQEFSDRQGETALRFRLRLTGLKRSAPSCKHGSHPFFNPAPCLLQVLESPPSQLAVGNCMYFEWHLHIGKYCFVFTETLSYSAKRKLWNGILSRYVIVFYSDIHIFLSFTVFFREYHGYLINSGDGKFPQHRGRLFDRSQDSTASCDGGYSVICKKQGQGRIESSVLCLHKGRAFYSDRAA